MKNSNKKDLNFKIKYRINRVTQFANKNNRIIQAILNTEEIDIFASAAIKDFGTYHWELYGKYPMYFGIAIYTIYVLFMFKYIDMEFHEKAPHHEARIWLIPILFLQIVSFVTDATKFVCDPYRYLSRVSNVVDLINHLFGFLNLWIQYSYGGEELYQKIIFLILVATTLLKYFNFLKAIKQLSYLIYLLEYITFDKLVPFFLFYIILIGMIATMMAVCESSVMDEIKDYKQLPHITQRLINSLRLTQGAFTTGSSAINEMTLAEINLFFMVRIVSMVISNMIFMTFIVGTIMSTFNTLQPKLDVLIEKQRFLLIRDAQDIFGRRLHDKVWFPDFIVTRLQES